MSEQKNNSLPVAIIGVVLLLALGGGAWLYSQGGSSNSNNNKNKPQKPQSAVNYNNAVAGAEPAWSKGANNASFGKYWVRLLYGRELNRLEAELKNWENSH